MTSGRFRSVPISSIVVNRDDRQRKELTGLDELALSIRKRGLIHPIVITEDNLLVAGERRLTACRTILGWTAISAQLTSDLTEEELQLIELEENIKRVDMPWQDQCRSIARWHGIKLGLDPTWTQEQTAQEIGLTQPTVARHLEVASELTAGNEKVVNADRFSVAHNVVQRNNERKRTSAVNAGTAAFASAIGITNPEPEELSIPLLNADFHEWQKDYSGPKFNLIHCDFPYGIDVADGPRQNSAIQDHYDDSPDIYFSLLATLGDAMMNVVSDSAHLIFWFSPNFYTETLAALTRIGWTINSHPLIWHKSDNAGVAPDPQRWPRRTYEIAFIGSRGDRKLTQAGAKAASYAHPGTRDAAIHISEKPIPVLQHFMSMLCDEYSCVLDPTCGSGNALKVAQGLKANTVLGIEQSKEFYDNAVAAWSAGSGGLTSSL